MIIKHHRFVFRLLIVLSSACMPLVTMTALAQTPSNTEQSDAGQLKELKKFTDNLTSFSASFEQTVYDADSQPLQTSTGSATLKRPGKFTWHYQEPNEQLIVSDGKKVWIYDPDLEQVMVSPLGDRASGTPLALLMGEIPIEQEFDLKVLGKSDSIDWFELVPKSKDNDFETIFIGLNENGLAVMELRDNFGQATQIKFDGFKSNIPLDDGQFNFQPPKGVDVVGEG